MTEEQPKLFDHQPASCRQPLPYKELSGVDGYLMRTMFFDPTEVYERVHHKVNPFNRYNWSAWFTDLFPDRTDGLCSCGCGTVVPVGKRRWATKDCQMFAVSVWNIIGSRPEFIALVLEAYHGNGKMCTKCGERKWIDVDHIFPVSKGGGGSWLSNYQLLCKECHKQKTRDDFQWQKLKEKK